MKLAFIDEATAFNCKLRRRRRKIFSTTSVVIDEARINDVRRDYYFHLSDFIQPMPNVIALAPTLHGVDLLRTEPDRRKIKAYTDVVRIVANHALRIYRISYWDDNKLPNMLGLCFFGMITVMQNEHADDVLLPVVEIDTSKSSDQFRDFASMTHHLHQYRDYAESANISVRNSHNLAETVFFPKHYSPLGNIADVVSYLLLTRHRVMTGHELTPFKADIAKIANELEPHIYYDETIELQWTASP